jgi:anthranilate/para-aminobenzoate synthase component I
MRFIESHEKSPRAWYGGAIGMVNFNGDMNTGLTLRTIRIKDGDRRRCGPARRCSSIACRRKRKPKPN